MKIVQNLSLALWTLIITSVMTAGLMTLTGVQTHNLEDALAKRQQALDEAFTEWLDVQFEVGDAQSELLTLVIANKRGSTEFDNALNDAIKASTALEDKQAKLALAFEELSDVQAASPLIPIASLLFLLASILAAAWKDLVDVPEKDVPHKTVMSGVIIGLIVVLCIAGCLAGGLGVARS